MVAHLVHPIPETLWHYTTFTGFQGIISSKTIWTTEYRFLNDSEEFSHARMLTEKVVEALPESLSGLGLRDRAAARGTFLMVASFSEVGDQLSQ